MSRFSTIDEACELVTDGTHYTPKNAGAGVPFLTVKDVTDAALDLTNCSFITQQDFEAAKAGNSAPREGDVLFSKDGTVGKVHVVATSAPFAVLSSLAILRPKAGAVEPRYLGHALRSPSVLDDALKKKTGSAIRRIILSDLKKVRLALPPLADQRRIAEVLDRTEALRAKRRAALAQLDSLTQSLFLDLFENPVENPKKWRSCAVGEIADCIVPGRDKPKSFTGDIPWITTDDLHHLEVTTSSPKELGLNAAEIAEVRARIIPKGSVIISCVGDLGIVSLAGTGLVINQQLHSFQCHECVNNVFLMHCLAFQQAFMYAKASSTTLPYMNKTVCNSIPVIVPPISLQREFARRVTAVEALKRAQRASLAELDALFATLQHRAFRDEL